MTHQGVVLSFDTAKGFGFVATNERSIYFHQKHVQGGFILRRGDCIQFTLGESPRHEGKPECRDIVLVERAREAKKAVQS